MADECIKYGYLGLWLADWWLDLMRLVGDKSGSLVTICNLVDRVVI